MTEIKITPALLTDLRQKAEAAGGRPWEVQDRRRTMRSPHYHIAVVDDYWQDETELLIAETIGGKGQKVWANANHIAAANPAVVLALVEEIVSLKAASLENDIERARNVLAMFRGESQDFTEFYTEAELAAEGLDQPADPDPNNAIKWASWIERKQLEAEQYRSMTNDKKGQVE